MTKQIILFPILVQHVIFEEVAIWFREKDFDKLRYIESQLKEKLANETIICRENDFFDMVGGESFKLNRNFPAETYVPDKVKKSQKLCVAVRSKSNGSCLYSSASLACSCWEQ